MRFVMCPPKYLSVKIPNNVHMKKGQKVDVPRAMAQWRRLKNLCEALDVDVEELPPTPGAQDATFVANVGISIEPYIILANYKAPGRAVEVEPAKKFFEGLGYKTIQPPHHFEGEADLKKLGPGKYFGGYGQFTDIKALSWIMDKTGVTILPIKEIDPKTYHEDCCLFVIDEKNVLVTDGTVSPASLKIIEKAANVIMTPKGLKTTGITNGVSVPERKIYLSGTFQPEAPDYRKAMEWLNKTWDKFGYTVCFLDTDAVEPSGADLSCQIMHLDFEPKAQ